MSSPFTGVTPAGNPGAPATQWGLGLQAPIPSTFVPFPNLGQPAIPEVGYGEGGYGDGGYDSPGIPGSDAPSTQWTLYVLK